MMYAMREALTSIRISMGISCSLDSFPAFLTFFLTAGVGASCLEPLSSSSRAVRRVSLRLAGAWLVVLCILFIHRDRVVLFMS
jgi:hypothetical protein